LVGHVGIWSTEGASGRVRITRPGKDVGVKSCVRTKKKCCDDRPRCSSCPVLWERLERSGAAVLVERRRYRVLREPSKKEWRAARRAA
jgi:hypothetical protein